ncbi:Crp/Fnr family transcriptional regulator [Schwartzia sp. (in: firmicutes)]
MTHERRQILSEILGKNPLVAGLSEDELENFIASSSAKELVYEESGAVFHEGDRPAYIYILISGAIHIQKSAFSGRHILLTTINEPGDMFGEVYLFLKQPYDIYVEADAGTRLLALSGSCFGDGGESGSRAQFVLQRNLLSVFARKAYSMNRKLQVLSGGSLREKLARLVFQEMDENGVMELDGSRETLADWLAVTRPSLSRELGAMQRDGILSVDGRKIMVADRNKFEQYL